MTYEHISWYGGTKDRHKEADSGEQSETPPAEYYERKEREHKADQQEADE